MHKAKNTQDINLDLRIISTRETIQLTTLSRTSIWRKSRLNTDSFPSPIILGPNRIGWKLCEIKEWIESRPRVKQLVLMS